MRGLLARRMANKRKFGKRSPCGKLRQPTKSDAETAAMQTVQAQRVRLVGADHWRDQLSGSAFGRMRLNGMIHGMDCPTAISQTQYDDGDNWHTLLRSVFIQTGIPLPTARALDMDRVIGRSLDGDVSADDIVRLNGQRDTLMRCRASMTQVYTGLPDIMFDVIVSEQITRVDAALADIIRAGCDALAVAFRGK